MRISKLRFIFEKLLYLIWLNLNVYIEYVNAVIEISVIRIFDLLLLVLKIKLS